MRCSQPTPTSVSQTRKLNWRYVNMGITRHGIAAFTVLLAVTTTASGAEMMRAGQFNPRMFEEVLEATSDGKLTQEERGLMNRAMPEFKVPAIRDDRVLCQASRDGYMDCTISDVYNRCPDEVEVRFPGQNAPVTVGIECNPDRPDSDGNCECEFK
jgi:hypothetical protein